MARPPVELYCAAQGLQGLHGLQGLAEAQGLQGLHGLQGLAAAQGLQGLHGLAAAQGLQGLSLVAICTGVSAAWAMAAGSARALVRATAALRATTVSFRFRVFDMIHLVGLSLSWKPAGQSGAVTKCRCRPQAKAGSLKGGAPL